ncbi:unnamed protein product [Somion occarium]|uniref:Uncharacterized protein n=1 Tax=Somion occarium TaxID=3059160 RepID=A0ABP1DS75_9APHY
MEEGGGRSKVVSTTYQSQKRKAKLLQDPMVTVHGPSAVTCNRCGSYIKLSEKTEYEAAHWNAHRRLCNRRSEAEATTLKLRSQIRTTHLSNQDVSSLLASQSPPLTSEHAPQNSPSSDLNTGSTDETSFGHEDECSMSPDPPRTILHTEPNDDGSTPRITFPSISQELLDFPGEYVSRRPGVTLPSLAELGLASWIPPRPR